MNTILNVAEHRNTLQITRADILESARLLKVLENFPDRCRSDFTDTEDKSSWKLLDNSYIWKCNNSFSKAHKIRNLLQQCELNEVNTHVSEISDTFKNILLGSQ